MNEAVMGIGYGVMIGAGTPIVFRQKYSTMHWYLFWVGVIVGVGGLFV